MTLARARAAFARGDFEETLSLAAQAIDASPDEARLLRINAALRLERWQIAADDLQWLLDQRGANPKLARMLSECWVRIGNVNKIAQPEAALVSYRKAVAMNSRNSAARFNMALVLIANGRIHDAIDVLQQAVGIDPGDVATILLLAEQLIAIGDDDAAVARLGSIGPTATHDERRRAAFLFVEAGAPERAIDVAERLTDPPLDWSLALAAKLRGVGAIDLATRWLGARDGRNASARWRIALSRALGLPSASSSAEEIARVRDRFCDGLKTLIDEYPPQRIAAESIEADALLWDNFYLAYQGRDDTVLQREFGTWWSAALNSSAPQPPPKPRGERRIGFVSSLFHQCTVGSYFASWIEHLAASGWDVVLVNIGDRRDALTQRLTRASASEITLNGTVKENVTAVRDIRADILVYPELGLDYRTMALAAFRLAPLQVCAWGHPVTSGLPTIDVFLSCAAMEPPSAQAHYCERLITLPALGTRYLSPTIPPAISRDDLGLPVSGALYLVPHSLFKLHPDNDAIYAGIIASDPRATLVFFDGVDSGARRIFRRRLADTFAQHGLDVVARTRFLPMRSRDAFLQVVLACDVVLDSLNFSGGNASLDALHCGVPIVTMPGAFMRGRQTLGMLQQLGGTELICTSIPSMIETAVDVANDNARKRRFGATLRDNLPALTKSDAPLRALDDTLHTLLESH